MDLLFEITNKRGTLQTLILAVVVIHPMTLFATLAGIPYLNSYPIIDCFVKEEYENVPEIFRDCQMEEICQTPELFELSANSKSLQGFAYHFNLFCTSQFYIPLIMFFYFVGSIAGCIVLPSLPDKYGRLPVFRGLVYLNVFIQINYLFAINIQHVLFVSLLNGFVTYLGTALSLFITEFIERDLSGIIMSLRGASFGLTGILLTLFYMTVNSYYILFFITLVLSLLIMFIVEKYFVESPRWLNSKNRIETLQVFRHIAKINNRKEHLEVFLNENAQILNMSASEIHTIKKSYTIREIFGYKSQRKRLIILSILFFVCFLSYFAFISNLGKSAGNVFLESIVSFIACIVSEMVSGWSAGVFGRILVLKCFLILGGFGFMATKLTTSHILISVFVFCSSFGFSGMLNILQIYAMESFPTSIRGVSFGVLWLIGRFAALVTPLVISLSRYSAIVLGSALIFMAYICKELNETLGKDMQDDIPEVERKYSVLSMSKKDFKNLESFKASFKRISMMKTDDYFSISFGKNEMRH